MLLALCLALGVYWGFRARSESFPFIGLHELVPAEEIEWKCEGEVVALWERVLDQEGVSRSVDCGDMRTVFTPSLVGLPAWGYSASAELASSRRGFSYSLWVYGDLAEAA
ncbi:MAG TPA: hypothetical protein GX702_12580 [Chloroflexi bacterium]|nr:hypothetical protein [Chloroflexota bacterium]